MSAQGSVDDDYIACLDRVLGSRRTPDILATVLAGPEEGPIPLAALHEHAKGRPMAR